MIIAVKVVEGLAVYLTAKWLIIPVAVAVLAFASQVPALLAARRKAKPPGA